MRRCIDRLKGFFDERLAMSLDIEGGVRKMSLCGFSIGQRGAPEFLRHAANPDEG